MHRSRRLTGSYPRAAAHLVAAVLAVSALICTAWDGPATASTFARHPRSSRPQSAHSHAARTSKPSHRGWVKYYIVQPPKDGKKEFLFEIAAKTLGNGDLASKIFKLNKGRPQPGGGSLESPNLVLPGWILVLPASAHGAGVHDGPLPVVHASPSPSAAATPAGPAGAQASRHRAAGAPASRPSRLTEDAEIGGAVLIALLLAAAMLIMRRRREKAGDQVGHPERRDATARPASADRGRPVGKHLAGAAGSPLPQAAVLASNPRLGLAAIRFPPMFAALPAAGAGGAPGDRAAQDLAVPGAATQCEPDSAQEASRQAAPSYPSWLDGPAAAAGPTVVAGPTALAEPAGYGPITPAVPDTHVTQVMPASPAAPPTPVDKATPETPVTPGEMDDDGDVPWPDYLAPAGPPSTTAIRPASDDQPMARLPVMGTARTDPGAPGYVIPPEPSTSVPDVPGASTAGSAVTGHAATGAAAAGAAASWDPVIADRASATGASANSVVTSGFTEIPEDGTVAPLPSLADSRGDGTQRAETSPPELSHSPVELSPIALRILGAQRSNAQLAEAADVPIQRHRVALGDDRIEVVLAEAPAAGHGSRPRSGRTRLTATPYLVWTPLPYDAPDDGVAFACLGAGDEGCLFIDLAAAPGAVALGGDHAASVRLAESIAHQLTMAATAGRPCIIIAVGAVLPEPFPPGAVWVAALRDLASAATTGSGDDTEIVFCELRSNEDAFALARYVGSAQRRVVPIVLANLPSAPWTFTSQASLRPSQASLHPAFG